MAGLGPLLCRHCLERIPFVTDPRCQKCGKPARSQGHGEQSELDNGGSMILCDDCRSTPHFFTAVRAVALYDGAIRHWIRELKYEGNHRLGQPLGELLGLLARREPGMRSSRVIVPVPASPERRQRRGYNQADLLAAGVALRLRRPIDTGLVTRLRQTRAQNRLGVDERRRNLRGVFRVVEPGRVNGKRVLVVDDIYTTGATLDEISRELLRAGARSVTGVVLAIGARDRDWKGA